MTATTHFLAHSVAIRRRVDLGMAEKLVLEALVYRRGFNADCFCWPSLDTLACDCGCSPNTVRRALRGLAARSIVFTFAAPSTGRAHVRHYFCAWPCGEDAHVETAPPYFDASATGLGGVRLYPFSLGKGIGVAPFIAVAKGAKADPFIGNKGCNSDTKRVPDLNLKGARLAPETRYETDTEAGGISDAVSTDTPSPTAPPVLIFGTYTPDEERVVGLAWRLRDVAVPARWDEKVHTAVFENARRFRAIVGEGDEEAALRSILKHKSVRTPRALLEIAAEGKFTSISAAGVEEERRRAAERRISANIDRQMLARRAYLAGEPGPAPAALPSGANTC